MTTLRPIPRLSLSIIACLVLVLRLPGMDLKPFTGPDAITAGSVTTVQAAWDHLIVDGYQEHGLKDQAWDAALTNVLKTIARTRAGKNGPLSWNEARKEAKAVLAAGCQDPLAAWAEFVVENDLDWQARIILARNATDLMGKPDPEGKRWHWPLLEAECLLYQLQCWGKPRDPYAQMVISTLADRACGAISRAMMAESTLAPELFYNLVDVCDLGSKTVSQRLVDTVDQAAPASSLPQWAQLTIRARIRIANAWSWRGSDWAANVEQEAWQAFDRNLAEADGLLEQAWKLDPHHIEIARTGAIIAGAGKSAHPLRDWFRRGMQVVIDDPGLFRTVRNFQLPRWGGSYAAMLDLACDGVDSGRYDSELPFQMVYTCWAVISDGRDMNNMEEAKMELANPRVQKALAAMFAGYQARNPTQSDRFAMIHAAILWHAGLVAEAQKRLASVTTLNDVIAREYWIEWKTIQNATIDPLAVPPVERDGSRF